ncbi:hypothetical protein O181_024502 [Austropuccinia psidii MF-1]|uniref:Uncharacterized protein n=1 Tax=Austropuccinia psidii MF-1 TaxID=1389203 RepID=A0A9Q3CLM9_9BASI|nr:hypothetical protein [Austropuccinia psidii MF-1]
MQHESNKATPLISSTTYRHRARPSSAFGDLLVGACTLAFGKASLSATEQGLAIPVCVTNVCPTNVWNVFCRNSEASEADAA